ncbi:hypothetical protein AX14_001571 [Amanita brunnescens Koide BX004]|nr:hypothetical protein AX14_001571 [Amanita brunnescens Koide BX004]
MATGSPPLSNVPGTDPLDAFRIAIAKRVSDALPPLTLEQAYTGVDYGKKGADFTVALPRFRLPGNVDELAQRVVSQFQPDELVAFVTRDKGFLQFQANTQNMIRAVLTQINCQTRGTASGQPEYGSNESGKGKRVAIEYSSPNIAKSFHVGDLRSTIIGAFLANLYKACGWEVITLNYLGDWGTQIGMIAIGFEKYGSQEELENNAIKHLFDVYVKVNRDAETDPNVKVKAAKWFKRMEDGDESALKNWRVWRELSIRKYEEEYDRLNVKFDHYTGESQVDQEWMDKAVERADGMGLISDVEDGTSIYLTRDIAAAIERYDKFKFDKMIYVVYSRQNRHLAQTFKILELMGFPWAGSLLHVNYGLVSGMSRRKRTVVLLDQIIEEAAQVMHDQMQKNEEKYRAVEDPETTSREIGITGVKIQVMAAKRDHNYTLNWDRIKSFEGDTGSYLQYAHVRLASIGRENPHLLPLPPPSEIDIGTLTQSTQAREIVFLLGSYPDVVTTALRAHESSGVVTYLFRLSHAISGAWETVVVKGERDIVKARAKMWMYDSAREVLAAAMKLLSIRPLEWM